MEINKIKLVYFSPTGTTQKVMESIAKGIASQEVEHINMTLPERARQEIPPFSDELVIIGAPVYGGRLPVDAVKRLKKVKANNTLAVLIVVYGNREYEDALLELRDLVVELGFVPVAGGAFIGEHSFSTEDAPIANGRPDSQDLQLATGFGAKIREKVKALASPDALAELKVSGRSPYVAGGARPMNVAPATNGKMCTVCGTCAAVCPTTAISINGNVTTDIDQCIRCCACIKKCPAGAKVWEDGMVPNMAKLLSQYFYYPKEPRFFE